MKTTILFLTFTFLGLFQLANAQTDTVSVSGQLTNTNGTGIWTYFYIVENGNWLTANSVTDANGNYSANIPVNITQGTVNMYWHDCNGDTINASQSFNTGAMTVAFPTANYCTPAATGCQAYFDVNQATTQSGAIVSGTLVVTDSSFGSSPNGNLSYSWSFGDGNSGMGTQLTHTYSGNGPYQLCLTINDSLGCTDTFCDTISVDSLGMIIEAEGFTLVIGEYNAPLSIDNVNTVDVNIFPNPASDFINIEFNGSKQPLGQIRMFNLSGKIVYEKNVANSSYNILTISTQNIEAGVYLIQILDNDKLRSHKVIVK